MRLERLTGQANGWPQPMKNILIAGFQHETNTFGPSQATFEEFLEADGWPGLLTGDEVINGTRGINLPIAGFIEATQGSDMNLLPVVWASAEPSGFVTDDAFERISDMILQGIRSTPSLDGIYLDLHGAMVTQSHQDGEGELLARIRDLTGDDLPIVASLDLHANITARMVRHASAFCIFRTYPHIDMARTGARCYPVLRHLLSGTRLHAALRPVSFLVPLSAQYTGASPCRELYQSLEARSGEPFAYADIAMGFPPADIFDAGPAVLAYAKSQREADQIADHLINDLHAREAEFDSALLSAEEAVRQAMSYEGDQPVVIADVQDNPGAGATSDTTGVLKALVAGQARNAVLALLHDPNVSARAHKLGVGATFEAALGGRTGLAGMESYSARFRVLALSDGQFAFGGEMYAGAKAQLGPTALLEIVDPNSSVCVVVGSKRCQCLDRTIFTHLGIELEKTRIIAVKSTVHFRADFEPIAGRILHAKSPGVNFCDLSEVPYKNLRPTVRRH